ncbi:MAG TPA: response regulator [Candidatus Ozemobacteraceae bacterium]|nr:response regulator [Candidatus Ozemobacteraceae bacterium]
MTLARPAILFVDRDRNVLDGLKRLIRSMHLDWVTYYAATPAEAVSLMADIPLDVVVADLNLPPIYGGTLLKYAQEHHPEIARMILSAEANNESELLLQSTQAAHQFIAKPCKAELLETAISRALQLRKLLKNPELLRVIGGIPHLPSLPPLYTELVRELESETTSMEQIGGIIAKDVSMTGRVLQLVNSAFFGLPRKISSPSEAALFLGANVLKSLVLYVRLFFTAPDSPIPGLSLDEIWAHSSLAAVLAREIVRTQGGGQRMADDAMLAGMMHDIGKLLMLDVPGYMRPLLRRLNAGESFPEAEYAEFSVSHAEIGGYLLALWGFPDPVVEAVTCHHHPGMQIRKEFSPLTAVHVANAFLQNETEPPLERSYITALGLESRTQAWLDACRQMLREVRR